MITKAPPEPTLLNHTREYVSIWKYFNYSKLELNTIFKASIRFRYVPHTVLRKGAK